MKQSTHHGLTINRSRLLLLLIPFMLLAAVIFPAVSSIASRRLPVQENTGHVGAFTAEPDLQGPAIIVTNTADSAAGSLRQAILDANANPAADEVFFDQSLTGIVVLLSALPDLSGSITMNAPGANQLTVKRSTDAGTPAFRIFTINPGALVTISGLTLSNGNAGGGSFPDNSGGGILNNGGQLTLNNVVVDGNTSSSSAGGVADLPPSS